MKKEQLSPAMSRQILQDRRDGNAPVVAFADDDAIRRHPDRDPADPIRSPFMLDTDKIVYCPYYNRYADKTQVFSFYKNDDLTRRGLHVQLVSRIGRTIGKALGLNLELIEAIALGHDIGHTPFGHAGEAFLDQLLYRHTGRHFSHNIHSVRVLDKIFPYNLSLQVLNGIAAHDGEWELSEYHPRPLQDFADFDRLIEDCYHDKKNVRLLVPDTLEGCVMRISDIIAYLGKDRQDAEIAKLIRTEEFDDGAIGTFKSEIINNLIVNIIENSYGKSYITMDEAHFAALKKAKADNYAQIYLNDRVADRLHDTVMPMMEELYERMLTDLQEGNTDSPIFRHHINYVNQVKEPRDLPYEDTEPNQIVVDYIASMTDDYFIDLHAHLFPDSPYKIEYKGYFD